MGSTLAYNLCDSLDRLDVIKLFEGQIELHHSQTVYEHHAGDVNIDYLRLHDAFVTACRLLPRQYMSRSPSFEVEAALNGMPVIALRSSTKLGC